MPHVSAKNEAKHAELVLIEIRYAYSAFQRQIVDDVGYQGIKQRDGVFVRFGHFLFLQNGQTYVF